MVEIRFMNTLSDLAFILLLIAAVVASMLLRGRVILFAISVLLLPLPASLFELFTAPDVPTDPHLSTEELTLLNVQRFLVVIGATYIVAWISVLAGAAVSRFVNRMSRHESG